MKNTNIEISKLTDIKNTLDDTIKHATMLLKDLENNIKKISLEHPDIKIDKTILKLAKKEPEVEDKAIKGAVRFG